MISDSWDVALSGRNGVRNFMTLGSTTRSMGSRPSPPQATLGYPGASTNDFPAALSGVTAAGGTSLEPASAAALPSVRGVHRSAWSLARLGLLPQPTKPSWQTDHGCSGRSYADISADADPDTGMQVYDV